MHTNYKHMKLGDIEHVVYLQHSNPCTTITYTTYDNPMTHMLQYQCYCHAENEIIAK